MGENQSQIGTDQQDNQQQQQVCFMENNNNSEAKINSIPNSRIMNSNTISQTTSSTQSYQKAGDKRRREYSESTEATVKNNAEIMPNKQQLQQQYQQFPNLQYQEGGEMQIEKKRKDNNCREINVKLYFRKEMENMEVNLNLPEKWGNQSSSLKSSIELLGSNELKNYDKSQILHQLAKSTRQTRSGHISERERSILEQSSLQLEEVSQMLSSLPDDYANLHSVSTGLWDEKKGCYAQLQITASNEVAQLFQQQCQQLKGVNNGNNNVNKKNQAPVVNQNQYKKLYEALVQKNKNYKLGETNNNSSLTGHSQSTTAQDYNDEYANDFLGEVDDGCQQQQQNQKQQNQHGTTQQQQKINYDNNNLLQMPNQLSNNQNNNNSQSNNNLQESNQLCGSDQLQQFQ